MLHIYHWIDQKLSAMFLATVRRWDDELLSDRAIRRR